MMKLARILKLIECHLNPAFSNSNETWQIELTLSFSLTLTLTLLVAWFEKLKQLSESFSWAIE